MGSLINGHVTQMEGEWSCYGGCHFDGGRKVISEGEVVSWRENSHVMEMASLKLLQRK